MTVEGGCYAKVEVELKLQFMFCLFYNDVCDYKFKGSLYNVI